MTARRTKRRYAHELYPHAGEWEVRPLAIDVPYLYARMVGLSVWGTGWFADNGREAMDRMSAFTDAVGLALVADALNQGMTGDAAWRWAQERIGDGNEIAYERARYYGVPVEQIKPYPCGPTPDHHDHHGEPDARGWLPVTRAPGPEHECPDCTEPDAAAEAAELEAAGQRTLEVPA